MSPAPIRSALLFLLPVAAALCLSYFIAGPVHYYDEGGMLANALAVTGSNSADDNHYYFGYPILLAPSVLLADTPPELFRWVQLTNIFLYGLSCLLLFLLLRHQTTSTDLPPSYNRYFFAVCACLFPAFISFTHMAWSENLVFLLVTASAYFLFEVSRQGARYSILLLSLIIGFAIWTHPRLAPVAPSVLIAMLFLANREALASRLLVSSGVIIAMALAYHLLVHPYFESTRAESPGMLDEGDYFSGSPLAWLFSLDSSNLRTIIARICGQLLVFNINGFLLPGMAIAGVVRMYIQRGTGNEPGMTATLAPVVIFLSLSCIGVAILFGFYFEYFYEGVDVSRIRVDQWVYGRYTDPFIPVFLAISYFYRSKVSLLISAIVTLGLAAITFLCVPDRMSPPLYINVLSLWSYYLPIFKPTTDVVDRFYLIALVSAAFTGSFLVSYTFLRSRFFPLPILLLFLFSVVSSFEITRSHNSHANVRYKFGSEMRANLNPGDCIYVDKSSIRYEDNPGVVMPHGLYAFLVIPHELFDPARNLHGRSCRGLITMNPAPFNNNFKVVTEQTDRFYGMVRRGLPGAGVIDNVKP